MRSDKGEGQDGKKGVELSRPGELGSFGIEAGFF